MRYSIIGFFKVKKDTMKGVLLFVVLLVDLPKCKIASIVLLPGMNPCCSMLMLTSSLTLKSTTLSHSLMLLGFSIYVACFADAFAALFLLSFIH